MLREGIEPELQGVTLACGLKNIRCMFGFSNSGEARHRIPHARWALVVHDVVPAFFADESKGCVLWGQHD